MLKEQKELRKMKRYQAAKKGHLMNVGARTALRISETMVFAACASFPPLCLTFVGHADTTVVHWTTLRCQLRRQQEFFDQIRSRI